MILILILNMEVLMYKTTNSNSLLDNNIILHNLIETSKISDPSYVMSASTAWLRKNSKKTLYDLQQQFKKLRLPTLIISKKRKNIDYRLCVPGNALIEDSLKYEATFISSPSLISTTLPPSDTELKLTGYSCSKGYKFPIKLPNIKTLHNEGDIYLQLQWAAIKFSVDYVVVNPDDELKKDLSKIDEKTYIQCLLFNTKEEKLYAYIDAKTKECISEFGILVKPSENGNAESKLVVHLPTYLNS